jgi:hypothetical protein
MKNTKKRKAHYKACHQRYMSMYQFRPPDQPTQPNTQRHGNTGDAAFEAGLKEDQGRVGCAFLAVMVAAALIFGLWLGHRAGYTCGVIDGMEIVEKGQR